MLNIIHVAWYIMVDHNYTTCAEGRLTQKNFPGRGNFAVAASTMMGRISGIRNLGSWWGWTDRTDSDSMMI